MVYFLWKIIRHQIKSYYNLSSNELDRKFPDSETINPTKDYSDYINNRSKYRQLFGTTFQLVRNHSWYFKYLRNVAKVNGTTKSVFKDNLIRKSCLNDFRKLSWIKVKYEFKTIDKYNKQNKLNNENKEKNILIEEVKIDPFKNKNLLDIDKQQELSDTANFQSVIKFSDFGVLAFWGLRFLGWWGLKNIPSL